MQIRFNLYSSTHASRTRSDVAFKILEEHSGRVRSPTRTFATHDHVVSTEGEQRAPVLTKHLGNINALRENTDRHNIRLFDLNSAEQGIVHVIGPELGITLPGMTFVCGDSHTCTVEDWAVLVGE